jgi:hypothetical protein
MSSENELERLKRHANKMGYIILDKETERLRSMLCDARIDVRIPQEAKDQILRLAEEKGIKYQTLIRDFVIDGLRKEKVG